MDISPQQASDISEIEKQVAPGESSGPKMLSQNVEKDRSMLINLLAGLGISIISIGAVILLVVLPFGGKKSAPQPEVTQETIQLLSPNITVQAEYVNPFSQKAQYSNPFIATRNPFTNFTQ